MTPKRRLLIVTEYVIAFSTLPILGWCQVKFFDVPAPQAMHKFGRHFTRSQSTSLAPRNIIGGVQHRVEKLLFRLNSYQTCPRFTRKLCA